MLVESGSNCARTNKINLIKRKIGMGIMMTHTRDQMSFT